MYAVALGEEAAAGPAVRPAATGKANPATSTPNAPARVRPARHRINGASDAGREFAVRIRSSVFADQVTTCTVPTNGALSHCFHTETPARRRRAGQPRPPVRSSGPALR